MKTLLVFSFCAAVFAQAPFSGPQAGEPLPSFKTLMVNGPDAGREVDTVAGFGDAPVMLVFIHQLDRNVAAFLRPVEDYAKDRAAAGSLKTLFVYLAPDKVEGERRMQQVVKSLNMKSPVGVSVEGVEGPGAYGLNKQVAITAIAANQRRVTANVALVQPGMVDSPKLLAEVAKHAGGRVKSVKDLEEEMAKQRSMMARPMGQEGKPAPPPDPPEMVNLLRALIQRTNSGERVDQVVKELREWAGDDATKKSQLAAKLGVIIPLKYGTDYAQSQMPVLKTALEK